MFQTAGAKEINCDSYFYDYQSYFIQANFIFINNRL